MYKFIIIYFLLIFSLQFLQAHEMDKAIIIDGKIDKIDITNKILILITAKGHKYKIYAREEVLKKFKISNYVKSEVYLISIARIKKPNDKKKN